MNKYTGGGKRKRSASARQPLNRVCRWPERRGILISPRLHLLGQNSCDHLLQSLEPAASAPALQVDGSAAHRVGIEDRRQLARKLSVIDAHVALLVVCEGPAVEIRRADRDPHIVDHHGFVMEKGRIELENMNT